MGFMLLCLLSLRLSVTDTLPITTCPTAAIHKPDALHQISAVLVGLPHPNKFLLKGYNLASKISKIIFSTFKITLPLKNYLPSKDWHKEHFPVLFPRRCHILHLASLPPFLMPQMQGEFSAIPFLQGLAYKLQAKHIPKSILLK